MELFLLYLFTRLDAIKGALEPMFTIGFIMALIALFIGAVAYSESADETGAKIHMWSKKLAIISGILLAVNLVLPTSKQLAIVVGGSLVLDAVRSKEVKEMSGLVYDAVKKKLQEVSK